MAELALTLTNESDRPVVDRTGLSGQYAFELQWTLETSPTPTPSLPSLFTAVQEQLGLRLEPQRDQAEVLIIDRAERPSEN